MFYDLFVNYEAEMQKGCNKLPFNPPAALEHFEKLIELRKNNRIDLYLKLGISYELLREYKNAILYYKDIVEKLLDDPEQKKYVDSWKIDRYRFCVHEKIAFNSFRAMLHNLDYKYFDICETSLNSCITILDSSGLFDSPPQLSNGYKAGLLNNLGALYSMKNTTLATNALNQAIDLFPELPPAYLNKSVLTENYKERYSLVKQAYQAMKDRHNKRSKQIFEDDETNEDIIPRAVGYTEGDPKADLEYFVCLDFMQSFCSESELDFISLLGVICAAYSSNKPDSLLDYGSVRISRIHRPIFIHFRPSHHFLFKDLWYVDKFYDQ
jgi:tetratricopeptide (TPR) repeat protein